MKSGSERTLADKAGETGLNLGQNAMVAGDITQHVNIEHKHYGTTLVSGTCGTCGREIRAGAGWKCGQCGSSVCSDHYDKKAMLCQSCAHKDRESTREKYAAIFREHRAEGIIDPSKRKILRTQASRLGLAESEVAEIEREAGRSPDHHMEYARQQLEVGRHLLSQGKDRQALERLQAVENDLSHDHDFWPLFAEALARTQPDRALQWIYEKDVEIPERYVLEYVLQKSPAAASRAIHDGLKRYPEDPRLIACRVLELYEIYHLTKKAQDLDRALEELARAKDRGRHPYLVAVQAVLAEQPVPVDPHPFFRKLRQSRGSGLPVNLQGMIPGVVTEKLQTIGLAKWMGIPDESVAAPSGTDSDLNRQKFSSIVGYVPGLFFVPLIVESKSHFCRFHANQGLLVLLVMLLPQTVLPVLVRIFASVLPSFILVNIWPTFGLLASIVNPVVFFLAALGAWHSFHLRCVRLPVIGGFNIIKP
jgi:uncharacterized membrane protein